MYGREEDQGGRVGGVDRAAAAEAPRGRGGLSADAAEGQAMEVDRSEVDSEEVAGSLVVRGSDDCGCSDERSRCCCACHCHTSERLRGVDVGVEERRLPAVGYTPLVSVSCPPLPATNDAEETEAEGGGRGNGEAEECSALAPAEATGKVDGGGCAGAAPLLRKWERLSRGPLGCDCGRVREGERSLRCALANAA